MGGVEPETKNWGEWGEYGSLGTPWGPKLPSPGGRSLQGQDYS